MRRRFEPGILSRCEPTATAPPSFLGGSTPVSPATIRDLRRSFGALDALTRIVMQRLLERVWADQTFTAILVTHDAAEAVALADRAVVIGNGPIAEDIPVDLPHPRGSAEVAALEGPVLGQLLGPGTAG